MALGGGLAGNGIGQGGSDVGDVTSVTNSDGTLTISPTTGAVVGSLALGHANTWTGKQTLPLSDKGGQSFNVLAYGAKGDNATDDTAAVQAAINAAGANPGGGFVDFPPTATSEYVVSNLTIGNGTSTTASGYGGVYLRGLGGGASSLFTYPGGIITLKAKAGTTGALITVAGPLGGWGFPNLNIDCQGICDGVSGTSVSDGWSPNLSIYNFRTLGLYVTTVPGTYAGAGTGQSQCSNFANLRLIGGTAANWTALYLDTGATSGTLADSAFNTFDGLQIAFNPVNGKTQTGIYCKGAESCTFRNTRYTNVGTAISAGTTVRCIVFDYSSGNAGWPASNYFDKIDFGSSASGLITNIGSPNNTARPNFIYGIQGDNGTPANPNLANLVWGSRGDPGELIAPIVDYNPAAAAFPAVATGGTWGNVDATHLGGVTFTFPASGNVDVTLESLGTIAGTGSGAQQYMWRVIDTNNSNHASETATVMYQSAIANQVYVPLRRTVRLTGTPGAQGSINWQHTLAAAIPAGGGAQLGYGGTGDFGEWGPARIEVRAA